MKKLSVNQSLMMSAGIAHALGEMPHQVDLWGNPRGKHKLGSPWSHDREARKARNKKAKKARAKNRS